MNYDKYYYGKKPKIKFFPGALNLIKKLNRKYILTIASSGKKDNIINLLKQHGINNLFGLILAESAYTKEIIIKEILSKFRVRAEETIMIADTVGDLRVAKKVGLKTIAVTWGFHSSTLLKTADADYTTKNFKELENILK